MKLISSTYIYVTILFLGLFQSGNAQNGVAISAATSTADNSAMLDVQSTTKGALIPRMTNAQRSGISSPANGLLVYCTDAPVGLYYYNTAIPAWVILSAGALTGSGTTNYDAIWTGSGTLGTGLIYNSGSNIGIGTTTVPNTLTVNNAGTTANSQSSYPVAVERAGSVDFTIGSDASYAYLQSWNSKPLVVNGQGNNVGIGTTPGYKLDVAGDINTNTGFTISGAATTGNYLRGNGSNFVASAIQASDLSAAISGTANYMAKFTGANTIGNSSVIYESGGEIGINNTSPATGAAISFTTGGGGTTNNIAWGTGPYSSIYDNANVHYWTDDYTNYESGATGTGATFAWVVGVAKSGASSPGGTVWMSLNNGNLLVSNLAGTGTRPVWSDASGNLNNSGRAFGSSSGTLPSTSTTWPVNTWETLCSATLTLTAGEVVLISGSAVTYFPAGSGGDRFQFQLVVSGSNSATLNQWVDANYESITHNNTNYATPYSYAWTVPTSGSTTFTLQAATWNADDAFRATNANIIVVKQ